MVHSSLHKTPNEINGYVFIFGKNRICLAFLLRPDSWSVTMCDNSILIPYRNLAVISFDIITAAIIVVACFARCVFAPETKFYSIFLLGGLGGISIQF